MTDDHFWSLWQRERAQAMQASGIKPRDAREIAAKETAGRRRIAGQVGRAAAGEGRLIWRDFPDGTTRFYIACDSALVETRNEAGTKS